MNRLCIALLLGLVCSASAWAAPINYNESVNGDLPGSNNPLTTFVTDLGANEWRGFSFIGPTSTADLDSFAFTVPAGLQATAVEVFSINLVTPATVDQAIWALRQGNAHNSGPLIDILFSDPSTLSGYDSAAGVPLAPGTYGLTHGNTIGDPNAQLEYVFRVTVAQIPEPTTLALAALASVALMRRRR